MQKLAKGPPKKGGGKATRRESIDDDDYDPDFEPIQPVELDLDDPYKKVYTEDENTRAYRVFSMFDLDGSGFVTLREIERILTGGVSDRLLIETFLDGDTGIVFGLDEQNCPIIEKIDDFSPAYDKPSLLPGLRIRNVCGTDIPQNDRSSLN